MKVLLIVNQVFFFSSENEVQQLYTQMCYRTQFPFFPRTLIFLGLNVLIILLLNTLDFIPMQIVPL